MRSPYAVREALAAFHRAPLLVGLSALSIALSLFVVGLFGLTAYNIRRTIQEVEDRVEVVAYLRDGAARGEVERLQRDLHRLPQILRVEYVSKDEALADAVNDLSEFREVFTDLEVNPLPASLEIRLRPGHRETRTIERIAKSLVADPVVEEVDYGREWVGKIIALRRAAAGATVIIGVAFASVAVIIIAAAVRIAVFARREEIAIMRLVGATDGFIWRPFLLEALITGLLGGAAAVGLTYAAFQFVNVALVRLVWLPGVWTVAGLLAGAIFGLVAGALAVRRHLVAV